MHYIIIYKMRHNRKGPNRSKYTEKEVTEQILNGFQWRGSHGYEFLLNYYGEPNRITVANLKPLGEIVSRFINVPLSRNDYRVKSTLIKWFNDNLDQIKEVIHMVKMVF